jgi:LysR family glycine cleavage system transcriptional activator
MSNQLSSLNSLRAFDSAARHLSFQKAAAELNVTASAISQRIRTLENNLGTVLFKRLTRSVILTETGQILAVELREAFGIIDKALSRIAYKPTNNVLTVSTTTSFAEKWLLPHLPAFNEQFPDMDVRLFSLDKLTDFISDGVDVAIRFGRGNYPGLISEPLSENTYLPVCSPDLISNSKPLKDFSDLRGFTLIHTHWLQEAQAAPSWDQYFKAANIAKFDFTKQLSFSVETLSIRAAIEGQGIALAHELLIANDLASGSLIKPFGDGIKVSSKFSYYIVYPDEVEVSAKVALFREWLLFELE